MPSAFRSDRDPSQTTLSTAGSFSSLCSPGLRPVDGDGTSRMTSPDTATWTRRGGRCRMPSTSMPTTRAWPLSLSSSSRCCSSAHAAGEAGKMRPPRPQKSVANASSKVISVLASSAFINARRREHFKAFSAHACVPDFLSPDAVKVCASNFPLECARTVSCH